jgi:hypothetical protein
MAYTNNRAGPAKPLTLAIDIGGSHLKGVDAPISVKWFSGAKSTIVGRRINSRRSHGR